MKRLFTILISIFITFPVAAQAEKSIVIEQKSFRAVQTDALTGVNIDPIGLDYSKRPCARLKVKINRMTKAEINGIEVKPITNNAVMKCKTAEYDNGLIIEMTAKPQTRFYFHHNEFGDSNEVCLDLEADKEYYLESYLNQSFSIVINTNVVGADVYLDNVFKGQTDNNMSCTISDVMIGNHSLKIVYGNLSREQSIDVNKNSILFRQTINIEESKPQFVVFVVEPQNAVVTIDNNHYSLQDGAMQTVLNNGSYNYTVSAVGYHPQSGTFSVSGAKVEKIITLFADATTVTLTAPNNAEIWVNNEKKGSGEWSGILTSGTYIFESRKDGHRTATISKQITSDKPQQSYALPAPEPIVGSVVVTSTPIMAEVALDGKPVGRTPLELNNILVGKHALAVSKEGYGSNTQTISVTENSSANIKVNLSKNYALKGVTPINIDSSLTAEQLKEKGDTYFASKDYNAAVQYYYASALQGNVKGECNLGVCYKNGYGVAKDYSEAVKWFSKAANKGAAVAQSNLGVCYDFGYGVAKNPEKAVKWYRKSAEQGYATAQESLGWCYLNGSGVTKNYTEAVKWLSKAAEQGNSDAQVNLGWCYLNGCGVTKNYIEAVRWYSKAAEQGHPTAQINLGGCYENGTGVQKNQTEAVRWYRKAAEQSYADAQYNLGNCYSIGFGVEIDHTEAFKWYHKAAKQGQIESQLKLGNLYLLGKGVAVNYKEGFNWTKKAAEQGHSQAQHNLGCCYEYGWGVAENQETAISWYRKGAKQGNKMCKDALKRLGVE